MNLEQIQWTSSLVEEWLNIAAKVDRILPPVHNKPRVSQHWEIIREWYELLWDKDEDKPIPRFQPTNEQVSMWEEVVLRWFKLIDSDKDKKIIWLRACEMGWARIGRKVGLTRQSVSIRHKTAIERLVCMLNNFYPKKS